MWPGYEWYQELKRRGQMQDILGPVSLVRQAAALIQDADPERSRLLRAELGQLGDVRE